MWWWGPLRLAVVLVCGGEGVTAGELASSEGIMPAQSRDVVVVGWTGTLMIQTSSLNYLSACCGVIVACASGMLATLSVQDC